VIEVIGYVSVAIVVALYTWSVRRHVRASRDPYHGEHLRTALERLQDRKVRITLGQRPQDRATWASSVPGRVIAFTGKRAK